MDKVKNKNIAIICNTSWVAYNFRQGLMKTLISKNYNVFVFGLDDGYKDKIIALGCVFEELKYMTTKGTNPIKEALLIAELIKIYKKNKIDIISTYTVKPNIYGTFAARWLNIPAINTVSGLGYTFQNDNTLNKIIKMLFRTALKHASKVFFQNSDDLTTFLKYGLVDAKKTDVVAGSGVNLQKFQPKSTFNNLSTELTFLFSARLLRDKGIIEYIEAAKSVKKIYPNTKFWILGITFANPMAISIEEVLAYEKEGIIEYKGKTDNMSAFLEDVDVVVLPSYHEGMPRMLLEAMAKGLPIITTDAVGCRETVEDGINGFMVPIKNVIKLEKAMLQLIQLDTKSRKIMGEAGLKQAQTRFDENIVINAYVKATEHFIV